MSCSSSKHLESCPVIVLGAGGHAVVVISSLRRLGVKILGVTSVAKLETREILGVPVLGGDEEVLTKNPADIVLVNGIGAIEPGQTNRYLCAEKMRTLGYQFYTVVDPSAITVPEVSIGEGVQIMAGAVVQPRTSIGADCIINTGVQIDHDCEIGINCHVCPGTILAGHVQVGQGSIIGAGTTVIPGVKIGAGSLIAAGSVIFKDVPSGSRIIQKRINLPSNQKT